MRKFSYINAVCAVPVVSLADTKTNAERTIACMNESPEASVLLFPELGLTGYTCADLFFQTPLIDGALTALKKVLEASRERKTVVVVGLPISAQGRLFNCAAVLQDGVLLGVVPKTYLPENREYYEKRWFSGAHEFRGDSIKLFGQDVPFGSDLIFEDRQNPEHRFGVEVCEDLWSPVPPSSRLAQEGALVILNPSASNETIGKADYRTDLLRQQSARLLCGYLYSSCGYGESTTDLVFGGDMLICENGRILARAERFKTCAQRICAQIDLESLLHDRRMQSSYRESRAEHPCRIVPAVLALAEKITRVYDKNPFVPGNADERDRRCEEIFQIQVLGLGSRIAHIANAPMIVGVSGGLDSTLALLVCHETCKRFGLPYDHVLAVTMPGFGTTDRTYDNAVSLINILGARLREISIKDAARLHLKDIGHPEELHNAVYENAQARERTQVLMDTANAAGGIVVGTGDLSELALGWATYNGDHMSMYGVNAGIPKTLVRYLVGWYADRSDEKLRHILYDILDTPVSPELLPPEEDGSIAQKTEDLVGPYELHDFFLFHTVRNGFSPEKIYTLACQSFEDSYDSKTILKWLGIFFRRFFNQQFKRSCLPDGPKVGSVTLSPRGDWRMPSDASSALWLAEIAALEQA